MSFRLTLVTSAVAACVLAVACSSSPPSAVATSPDGGSTTPTPDGGSTTDDAAASEAGTDGASATCDGACTTTSLVVDIGGKKRTLVRAQFGTQTGAAGPELHTESHLGGQAACPSQQSPSPDYTLVVSSVPRGAVGKKLSDRDGLTSAFFDFKGDLGLAAPSGITKAISLDVTVVGEDPATQPGWVALDVIAAFTEGEVRGHLYAEYCDSLAQ